MKHAVIIGGGIAGLSAAYYLKKQGVEVTLLEKGSSVGGVIRTVLKHDRYLLELGPNTFLGSSDPIYELTREIQIENQLVQNESKKRFIYCGTKLNEVPTGPGRFLRSSILSRRGRLRVLMEPFIRKKVIGNESLAAFVTRRGGRELLETMVDPLISGIYAGDPFQLEIKSIFPVLVEMEEKYGSIFKGMRHLKGLGKSSLLSFRWGMETLPARLHDLLRHAVRLDIAAEGVEPLPNGRWVVYTNSQDIHADTVIIATPATETTRLLMPHVPEIFSPMMSIPYVSIAVVHTVFRQPEIPIPLDGFGFLIPRREKIRLLGSIWSSALFPRRAPDGEALLTNFIGGALDPHAADLDDNELLTHVCSGLEKTMGIHTEPRFFHIKRIPQAIPQYTIGHAARLDEIGKCLRKLPGIFLAGSYFDGISVADTVAHSKKVAALAQSYLHGPA